MKRLCTFLVLLASTCAYGQVGPVSITSAECATIGVGAKVSVITFQVTGTWTGTLQPKITVQGQAAANVQVTPSTSSTAASTVTANGIYTAQVNGADTFQVCGNTVASGTANVYLNVSVASKGGSSSGTSGTVTSIATTSPVTGGTITGTGTIACATCAIGPGSSTANHLAKFSGSDGVTLADGGAIPAGTVTSIATTSPVGGGTITGTGTLTCTTCVVASSPGVGLAHFAGSTQTVTSSAIVAADITSGTITGTQLSSSIALPNGATATTQSASDNSTKVATTAYADRVAVSDGLSMFGTLAVGSGTSVTSIASNSITVATTGVVYVFCAHWSGSAATLTLSDTLTSTITSLGDTGNNTTTNNSNMHAWKVVPASNGSDAFTCAGGGAGGHMDVMAYYYPSPGTKTVDVSSFSNANADQSGKSVSLTPTATDRMLVAMFSPSSASDKFSGFSANTLAENAATSGNSLWIFERPNVPSGALGFTGYGITNQPFHIAAIAVN